MEKEKEIIDKRKIRKKNSNFDTLITGNNTINIEVGSRKFKKDISEITYYNRNKKGYYFWDYSKLKRKNSKN